MKFGLFAPASNPFATPEYLAALARGAEERGFHSLWMAEHVVLFDEYASRYPYSADGRIPAGPENGILDPFGVLSFVAGVTQRLRLGTGICLVPQRNPVYTAKEVATLDWLSGGRFDFGVGVGWLAEEFRALGVPFERRGARCRAYLEVMKRLWCDPVSSYEGEFYSLPPCRQYPKPVQKPHPPIFFGGESDAALRRVADLGQGWYPFSLGPEGLAERLRKLEEYLARNGRRRSEIRISVCPYLLPCTLETVEHYRDLGVEQVIFLFLARDAEDVPRVLDQLAESYVAKARDW
ncbi:MAG: LLM class F420-dependent oxidoreductase [Candidatus Binatia bacterium]|nr:MAG: LLM class F420-dependent oxidoreductase [Candidatus Binatia bacterium]